LLSNDDHGGHVHVDLDTLATALYVKIDDELKASPQLNRWRPKIGIAPKITDAELITVSVLQALLGYADESRWIRHARKALIHLFPRLPKQPGYNKRLRLLGAQITHLIAVLAADTDLWHHPIRVADSTPVPCGTSRETVKRSELAGWAGYGYCASHSRRFWGLRLHLVTTVHGLPVAFALTNATTDEREVLVDLVTLQPDVFHHPDGLILVVDKGYRDQYTETWLGDRGITVVRPAYRNETPRPGRALLHAVRQSIESVNDTFKGQLSLEQHGGRTITGVAVRVLQRILALTAAIWHNWHTGQPVMRSLVAYDH
jgi:Transposase DDE domain